MNNGGIIPPNAVLPAAERYHLMTKIDKLQYYKIPAAKICFEITETVAISNLTDAIAFIDAMHEKGCRFVLDDFGNRLSSFAYLKYLPVDY
jgi:EAL domain-containing protein (putative c-di-GMP-specific phosphodiesterase class I)